MNEADARWQAILDARQDREPARLRRVPSGRQSAPNRKSQFNEALPSRQLVARSAAPQMSPELA